MEKTKGRPITEWMTNIKEGRVMRDYNLCGDSFLCAYR